MHFLKIPTCKVFLKSFLKGLPVIYSCLWLFVWLLRQDIFTELWLSWNCLLYFDTHNMLLDGWGILKADISSLLETCPQWSGKITIQMNTTKWGPSTFWSPPCTLVITVHENIPQHLEAGEVVHNSKFSVTYPKIVILNLNKY